MLSMIDCIVRSKACFLSTANQMAMSLLETEGERANDAYIVSLTLRHSSSLIE